jgi:cell division protein FtsB
VLTAKLQEWPSSWIKEVRKALKKAVPKSPKGEYVVWGLFLGLSLWFLWSAFSGPQGAVKLLRLKGALRQLEEKNRVLLRENQRLEKEIYLLRTNPAYQEKIAREEYGYSYTGERVYTFSDPDPTGSKGTLEGKNRQKSPGSP